MPHGEIHQAYVTVAALDDFFMVSIPGEPNYSVVKYLRDALTARNLKGMAFGYSQDHLLYLSHPDDWFQGGYETEMSLWGPLAGKYIIDRQLELVAALAAGEATPVWSEDSPNLSLPQAFTPRAREASDDAGVLVQDTPDVLARGTTLRFAWGGGDPALGEPRVVLEVQGQGGGGFTAVPSPSGWPGAAFDNSRYHMLTHYTPTPAPNGQVLASRQHHWYVDFQAPLDLPAGTYRLVASGPTWDGDSQSTYTVPSSPFKVGISGADQLQVTLNQGTLTLHWTHTQPAYTLEKTWPVAGYRLLDPEVPPNEPATIREPIKILFRLDNQQVGPSYTVEHTPGVGHVFDFAATRLDSSGLSVFAHLATDITPDEIGAKLP